ncbi:MAG TPA: Dyp-type peroxidase, partial [Acidimicrobiales bacterium]|nr:Dyp-type peroxidase [Acidimicrobiales bacterium]
AALFLVVTVDPGAEEIVRDLLTDLAGLERTVGFRVPTAGLALVTGIGSDAWDRLFAGPRPAELHPFRALDGARHHAVSTPGDLLFHIRAVQADLCFELASQIMDRLAGSATVVDEVHGFKYFDDRDLLGFVDGTENPTGAAARAAVTVGAEDPDFSGSSYVIVQKYLHDLTAWNALSVEAQELVVGRKKLSNVELPDDEKPSNSHVALNTVVGPDGEQRQILRDNMAFGTIGQREFGTYFIGYAATPAVTEQMLVNMFIGDPPGNHDRILDFSTAVTGSLFFVPTADFLDDLPLAPGDVGHPPTADRAPDAADLAPETAEGTSRPDAGRPDGSLGIAGLKSPEPPG